MSEDEIDKAQHCLEKAESMMGRDFYGRGRCKLKQTQAKLSVRRGDMLRADALLQEGRELATQAQSLIDIQFCDQLLEAVHRSEEYAKQRLKKEVEDGGKGREEDWEFEGMGFRPKEESWDEEERGWGEGVGVAVVRRTIKEEGC